MTTETAGIRQAEVAAGLSHCLTAPPLAGPPQGPHAPGLCAPASALDRHGRLVCRLSSTMCRLLGLDRDQTSRIVLAARTHDIGKRQVPAEILGSPGPLDGAALAVLRGHTTLGATMLQRRGLDLAATVALRHHELWDGSGYPDGLKGADIPLAVRLVTICDVYAALREDRPYKPGLSHEVALDTMLRGDGSGRTRPEIFDPALFEVLLRHHTLFARVSDEPGGDQPPGQSENPAPSGLGIAPCKSK